MANQDIEESFKNKTSNEYYKYYYCNESSKQIINCWSQLIHFYYDVFLEQEASEWLFRGDIAVCDQKRSIKEAFKTSLDKAFEEFSIPANKKSQEDETKTVRNKIEEAIIRSFRRRAHLLTGDKESTQTQLENMALLRHHKAPARILDWMYSFFTAVYFAVNRYDKNHKYVVWALNRKYLKYISERLENEFINDKEYLLYHFAYKRKKRWLSIIRKKMYLRIKEKFEYYKEFENNRLQNYLITYIIYKNFKPLIYSATPYHLNERLAAQRGTLLFSGMVDNTWGENLHEIINDSVSNWPPKDKNGTEIKKVKPILWEICIELNTEMRNDFLKKLDEMNINQSTLFPDLDGFAESLRTRIAHPKSLGIPDDITSSNNDKSEGQK